eukprot:scaffold83610_cov21-Tisochrysis_lutea.AAC.2
MRHSGYASLDLSAIPEVRPGLLLKIVETPERQAPLGKPGVDVLMPKGEIVPGIVRRPPCTLPASYLCLATYISRGTQLVIGCPYPAEITYSVVVLCVWKGRTGKELKGGTLKGL